jgi:transcriptional regulator GlxA family with amidase domain
MKQAPKRHIGAVRIASYVSIVGILAEVRNGHASAACISVAGHGFKQERPHGAGVLAWLQDVVYSAAVAAALRAGSFSLMRADLPERSRR